MARETPPWLDYLRKERGETKPIESISLESYNFGPQGRTPEVTQAMKDYEAARLVGAGLGVEEEKPKGFLSKALDVITYPFAVASSGAKEFIVDPFNKLYYGITGPVFEGAGRPVEVRESDKISIQQFKDNVKNRSFARELYPELAYTKDASFIEKAGKEIGGLAIDILSSGGVGTGVRIGGALGVFGRKRAPEMVANAAKDVYTANAIRSGRTAQEAAKEANDFAAEVGVSLLQGRSGAVAQTFEKTFGKELGRKLYKEMPREAQGGLTLQVTGRTIANLNAGGYLMDDLARTLRLDDIAAKYKLPAFSGNLDRAVNRYQNARNVLRGDLIANKQVGGVVSILNGFLNRVGGQNSPVYQSVVRLAAQEGKDREAVQAFKGFQAVKLIQDFRNVRMEYAKDSTDLIDDYARLQKSNPAAAEKALEFMQYPGRVTVANLDDPIEQVATSFQAKFQDEWDRYYNLLTENGFEMGYQNNYLPLLYAKNEDAEKLFAEIIKAGPQNIAGKGYDPTKARLQYMKDKIDPVTRKVVIDPETGRPVQVPMLPSEVKEYLTRIGRKDLADMIEDNPMVLLARYAMTTSRMLAQKKVMDDVIRRGALFKSTTLQLSPNEPAIQEALATIARLPRVRLDQTMKEFAETPGALSKYIESLNEDLVTAFNANDKAAIDAVMQQMDNFFLGLDGVAERYGRQLKKYSNRKKDLEDQLAVTQTKELKDEIDAISKQLGELDVQKQLIKSEAAKMRAIAEGKELPTGDITPRNLADILTRQSPDVYRPVGGSEVLSHQNFYMPEQLAELTGEKALVELIDRAMLLRNNDPKMITEAGKAFDAYLQFFRVGATFGRLTGFVLRNLSGAIQNNLLIAGSTGKDHIQAGEIAKTRVLTEFALQPFRDLSRADKASGRLNKLIRSGKLTEDQAKPLRDDIERYGLVQNKTVDNLQNELLQQELEKKFIEPGLSYWDVYRVAQDSGIYDRYVVLQGYSDLNPDDAAAALLPQDKNRLVIRTDRIGSERSLLQKGGEGLLNIGVTVKADVAGRTINLKPTQLTRDLNGLIEEFVRLAPIITGLRKYGAGEGGAANAIMTMKAAQFDYSDLTFTERKVLRRIMPFYTFFSRNLSAQLRVLFNDPTRIQRNFQGWEAVSNILADDNGDSVVIPEYVSSLWGFLVDEDIRKAISKESPEWLQAVLQNPLAFRPESPILDLERYSKGGLTNLLQEQISSANPLAKATLQYALNMNMFSRREYSDFDPAPNWYVLLDKALSTATGGEVSLGVYPDPKTGQMVTNGKGVDVFKTILPQLGTIERTAIPMIEMGIEAITGKPSDFSGKMSERAVSNLLSQLAGINLTTITPDVEQATYYRMRNNIDENVKLIALQQGIDLNRVREMTRQLRAQGYSEPDIISMLDQELRAGNFNVGPM